MINELNKLLILPCFILVLLYIISLFVMVKRRVDAVKSKQVPYTYFKTLTVTSDFKVPNYLEQSQRLYINLFEAPMLFFAVIPLILVFDVNKVFYVALAWAFVFFRYVQSIIHLTNNKIQPRQLSFTLGLVCILAMWIRLIVDIWV